MISLRVLLATVPLLLTVSCTTQKALTETGKEIDKGNYGVAAWYTLTLPIVMVYDIFTLGGTSDVSSGTSTLSSAASTIAPNSNAANTLSAMASSSTLLSASNDTSAPPQTSQASLASERIETNNSIDLSTFNPAEYMREDGTCAEDLSYLSNRLPESSIPEINNFRNELLKSEIKPIMYAINKKGISPDESIRQELQQAEEYNRVVKDAIHTATQTDGQGVTETQFASQIKSGTLQVNICDGIRNSSLCAAIINSYSAISTQAIAANLMCYKRTNQWPKG